MKVHRCFGYVDCEFCQETEKLNAEIAALRVALGQIELNTRNASVVGHPGITCRECEETNLACSEALNKKD